MTAVAIWVCEGTYLKVIETPSSRANQTSYFWRSSGSSVSFGSGVSVASELGDGSSLPAVMGSPSSPQDARSSRAAIRTNVLLIQDETFAVAAWLLGIDRVCPTGTLPA